MTGRRRISGRVAAVLLAACAACAACALPGATFAAAEREPTLTLRSAKIQRSADGGGTVLLRMRVCLSVGPRARMITREARIVDGRVVARRRHVDPMGVDLPGVMPYGCALRYEADWVVPARLLRRPGRYRVVVWIVDGHGQRSESVRVSG